jgi:hypothetical protein
MSKRSGALPSVNPIVDAYYQRLEQEAALQLQRERFVAELQRALPRRPGLFRRRVHASAARTRDVLASHLAEFKRDMLYPEAEPLLPPPDPGTLRSLRGSPIAGACPIDLDQQLIRFKNHLSGQGGVLGIEATVTPPTTVGEMWFEYVPPQKGRISVVLGLRVKGFYGVIVYKDAAYYFAVLLSGAFLTPHIKASCSLDVRVRVFGLNGPAEAKRTIFSVPRTDSTVVVVNTMNDYVPVFNAFANPGLRVQVDAGVPVLIHVEANLKREAFSNWAMVDTDFCSNGSGISIPPITVQGDWPIDSGPIG